MSIDLIKRLSGKTPILGICLGHQAIVEAFGGEIIHALELVHGKKRPVHILMDEERAESLCPLFHGLPEIIEVARYHSLAANTQKMPDELVVTALAPDQTIMAVHHKTAPVFGIQFHPESILTTVGETIMRNFLSQRA